MSDSKQERQGPHWMTPPQVARELRVHVDRVRRWIKQGQLRALDVGDGGIPRYRISAEDLEAYLIRRETAEKK